jgi:flagellin
MQITSNATAVNYANNAKAAYEKTLKQIASGLQLSSTDGASQSMYDSLQSQSDTYAQGIKNANDGIGYLQIADGATQTLSSGADQLNTLSAAYNNGALNASDKQIIQQQADGIKQSMKDAISGSSFNGKNVFSGDASFYTGSGTQSFSISAPNIDSLDVTNQDSIQGFQKQVSSLQSNIGSSINGLQSSINSNLGSMVSASSSASQIGDTNYAQSMNELNTNNLLMNTSLFAQAQANNISASSVASLLA